MVGGRRTPFIIELDSEMTVIMEYVDNAAAAHVASGRDSGGEEDTSPERKRARLMARWAARSVAENPIDGTDGMRADYFKELDDMVRKHTQNGGKCPDCKVGALIRRFRGKLEAGGFL